MTAATSQKLSIPSSPAMGEALQKPDRPVVVPTLEQKAPAAGKPEPNRRVIVLPIVGVLLVLAALWYGYGWLTTGRFMVTVVVMGEASEAPLHVRFTLIVGAEANCCCRYAVS